jgi:hypothetical protein
MTSQLQRLGGLMQMACTSETGTIFVWLYSRYRNLTGAESPLCPLNAKSQATRGY